MQTILTPRLHSLYARIETAFVASGIVTVNQSFIDTGIDNRLSRFEGRLRCFFIAFLDSLEHALYVRAQARFQTSIVAPALFRLPGALFSGSDVCQECLLLMCRLTKVAYYR